MLQRYHHEGSIIERDLDRMNEGTAECFRELRQLAERESQAGNTRPLSAVVKLESRQKMLHAYLEAYMPRVTATNYAWTLVD